MAPRVGHPEDTGAMICTNQNGALTSPYATAPAPLGGTTATITVSPSSTGFTGVANRTYWFSGTTFNIHQIQPAAGDVFVGAPGAILDGQHTQQKVFAEIFGGNSDNVTISYLTIKNYNTPQDQGLVNSESRDGWTVTHNTIGPNDNGAAMFLGDGMTITNNCITHNGQYGINGFNACNSSAPTGCATPGGPISNVTIDHNEFAQNNTQNYDQPQLAGDPGDCGCSGGLKLWQEIDTTFTNNYVHANHSVGLWPDTNNVGIVITGNYISDNWNEGLFYEVSYNATVKYNTFYRNGWVDGPLDPTFPHAAIYISESGWDTRVNSGSGVTEQEIAFNNIVDNWTGIALWENPNRYCSNGLPTTQCTLIGGAITVSNCAANLPASPELYDCRWRTQNNHVHNNTFGHTTGNITPGSYFDSAGTLTQSGCTTGPCTRACNATNHCGRIDLVSQFSGTSHWPSDLIPHKITWSQGNTFDHNAYTGPWVFDTNEENQSPEAHISFTTWKTLTGTEGASNGTPTNTENHPAMDASSTCTGCP